MREKTVSFILKMHLLLPTQPSEGEVILRGSVQQVGLGEARHFGSWEGLLAILRERIAAAKSDRGTMTRPERLGDS